MQSNQCPYRRTPLPPSARLRLGWIFLGLAGLLASPFIGFAIQGRVDEAGLVIGLGIALAPLTGLAGLAISHWLAIRQLPREIAEEWRSGKVIPANGAPHIVAPVGFSYQENSIELRADGVIVSKSALLGLRGIPDATAKMWISQAVGDFFVPWADIRGWVVCTDSDGPDFFRLQLRNQGYVLIRRFTPKEASEAHLLDAVRSLGNVPIRMLCDLTEF